VYKRQGIISSLINDERFEVYLITTTKTEESIYNVVINSTGFKNKIIINESIEEARKVISNLNLNILVYPEIQMDLFFYLLAFSRLAPIQINTWGHSETSGIDTIDYFMSSKYYEQEDGNKFYSENLIKLDSLCTYYYSLRIFDFSQNVRNLTQEQLRVEKNLPKTGIIYGMFQTVFKYQPETIQIIKEILYQDPKAIIIMLTYDELGERFIDYLDKNLGYHSNRVRIFPRTNLHEYTKLIKCVDIVLDSYPFGGCNSSLEAFYLNKVVITMPANKINGRFTYGFYLKMGILEPVCYNQNEFVTKAIFYANNKTELKKLESAIEKNSEKLFEENASVITWKDKLISLFNENKINTINNKISDYDIDYFNINVEFDMNFYNKTYNYNFSNYELAYNDWKNKIKLGFKGNFHIENNIVYYSQINQDYLVINDLFKKCENGTFVEFGACDGKFLSNTYTLEKYYNWTGILIEPDENYYNQLVKNRKSTCVKELVYSENNVDLFFELNQKPELNKINLNANGIKINSKTLEKILDENNCSKTIHYMSVDIEGFEYEALKNFPFNKKYTVYCLSIEHGMDNEYKKKINQLMFANNYILYKELLWDNIYVLPDLLCKYVVNSFDFFDTLVHRHYFSENSVLEIIANITNDSDFIANRKLAEFNTPDNSLEKIYFNMNKQYKNIQNLEFEFEKKYLFLNKQNLNKLKPNDIIISDTFYSNIEFGEILCGLGIKNKYFTSKNGKKTGSIYKTLQKDYIIISHTGDNQISDYEMALANNINSIYGNFGQFNNFEKMVNNYSYNLALILRHIRLSTSCDNNLMETFQYIFVCNCLIFNIVTKYSTLHKNTNLLLTMRDCCLLYKIFSLFENKINLKYSKLYTSRLCYNNPSNNFINYFKTLLNESNNLIVDMNGTGKTLLNFLEKNNILNCDNLYIVKFGNNDKCNFIYENKNYIDILEYMNCDINGRTIDYINEPIFCPIEYEHLNEISKLHKIFDQTCNFINSDIKIKNELYDEIVKISTNSLNIIFDNCINNFTTTKYCKDSFNSNK
jgi:FkbM family methyltransferase